MSRTQLVALGFSEKAIKHRITRGRLHPIWRGVYAVGRPGLSQQGRWVAAVLACAPHAVLSHESAAARWGIRPPRGTIEVSVPRRAAPTHPGIVVHRRIALGPEDVTHKAGIPLTTPTCTLVDLAARLDRGPLEAAINEADKRDLITPEALRVELDRLRRRPGLGVLKRTLDRRTFRLTDSELERRFLALVRRARLPSPETGRRVNGFKVDFYWPDLGLVVETDGLRYHRTPTEQAKDRLRDQAHMAAGLLPLRFTDAQVRYEPAYVIEKLAAVARRLGPTPRSRRTRPRRARSG